MDAYNKIKKLTRGVSLDRDGYLSLVNKLDLPEKDKQALLDLTPATYSGEIKRILKKY